MRLYEGSVTDFNAEVIRSTLADKLADKFQNYYQKAVGKSEYRAWQQSSQYLKNSFEAATLSDNRLIIEYELPYSSRRIDVLLFGSDSAQKDSIVLLELKQWSNDNVSDASAEGNVNVDYGQFVKEVAHPSLQVEGYHFDLQDFLKVFEDHNPPRLSSAAYCHNYARLKEPRILFAPKFSATREKFPIFAKEDTVALGNYLREKLANGSGLEVFGRFTRSPVRPSKKLLEHTGEMINKQQVFTLIDDQIAAYNAIMHRVKTLARPIKKSVIIVKGGPGTGKSVIALEVMGQLLRRNKSVVHATGSAAFTNTLRKLVGTRAKGLFKFFNSFVNAEENAFDVLIADEAHRIRETSSRGWPRPQRSDVPQVDELLKLARLCIFFIDEKQIVRPNEVGSIHLIKDAAEKFGIPASEIPEFELHTQFRCSGSDAYLQWLDHVMKIREAELPRFDERMEFRIFDDPGEMMEEVRARNREKKNSARIAAGFCWRWSKPRRDGSLVNDVQIGRFEMPWEKKDAFWKWATDDSGMEQVGTVYTAQGFEFDYIAVIFGNDLIYDAKENTWKAVPTHSFDTQVTRGNPDLTEHLKSVYRVLLSRAHKGVYVHFMDPGTRQYFESQLRHTVEPVKRRDEQDVESRLEPVMSTDVPTARRFRTHLPVYSLSAAAGGFSESQEVRPLGWVPVSIGRTLSKDMFIAQVKGRSMEPMISEGTYCIFRFERGGSRNGKVVLVKSRHVNDPDDGAQYTVKRYFSEKNFYADGTWDHKKITLVSDNREYEDIVLEGIPPREFEVIAEFISCLPHNLQRTEP
jgi:uncharacterized protein